MVSRATGIPVSKMMQGERDKLLQMEDKLHQRVVGQDEAVRLVADASAARAPACRTREPPDGGSFLFLGPTGVGKTELCKRSPSSCSTARHLIRIDMSEFMEKHSVARLIGAPRATWATRKAAT